MGGLSENKTCGYCQHFKYEDFCGVGWCEKHHHNPSCGDNRCNDFREKPTTKPKD